MPPFPTRTSKRRTECRSLSREETGDGCRAQVQVFPDYRDSRDLAEAERGETDDMDQVIT